MGQVCCIGHIDSRSEHLMLHTFSSLPANKVQVFTSTLSTLVQCLCSLSSSLSYLVVFSTTHIIFVVGEGDGWPLGNCDDSYCHMLQSSSVVEGRTA